MADAAQDKELKNALAQIEKQFGKGAIMQLGDDSVKEIEGISTGALSLDIALGGRGLPRGRPGDGGSSPQPPEPAERAQGRH